MHYRLYTSADFPQLYAIEEICFQPPLRFPRSYMRRVIENPDSATWIAEGEEKMAGFAIVEWAGPPGDCYAYIQTLEILPEHRRRGIGQELLHRLETSAAQAGAAEIWLHVDAANTPAIRLYRALGYQKTGSEQDYYGRHRPADVYSKTIRPGTRSAADS